MYHHIAAPPASAVIRGMYVTPEQFDWQIGYLKGRGYRFTTFADAAGETAPSIGITAERDARAGARVIITLDDGYRNNYLAALPILRRHGVPAVVYPIIDDLGRRGVTWPGATEQSPADMLSRDEVREMAAAGIEFGSHLLAHRRLTELTPAERARQLESSRAVLEELTGRPVLSIAYPYGDFDGAVLAATEQAGYRYGVTTVPGINAPGSNPLTLSRFTAKGCKLHHPFRFRRMIRGAEREIRETWPA
jgi:peptidoglycan/xylan/chitin deacetylase (PgdA/CDA1 family)